MEASSEMTTWLRIASAFRFTGSRFVLCRLTSADSHRAEPESVHFRAAAGETGGRRVAPSFSITGPAVGRH